MIFFLLLIILFGTHTSYAEFSPDDCRSEISTSTCPYFFIGTTDSNKNAQKIYQKNKNFIDDDSIENIFYTKNNHVLFKEGGEDIYYSNILHLISKSGYQRGYIPEKNDVILFESNLSKINNTLEYNDATNYYVRVFCKDDTILFNETKFQNYNKNSFELRSILLFPHLTNIRTYNIDKLKETLQGFAPCEKFNKTFGINGEESIESTETPKIKEKTWYQKFFEKITNGLKHIFS